MIMGVKIISGGQTGADRAALDAAIELRVEHGGHCPKGRMAEDGPIPRRYELQETPSSFYAVRTKTNVRNSHATVILTYGPPTGGSLLTQDFCRTSKRPCLLLDLDDLSAEEAISALTAFCEEQAPPDGPLVLNVAGSRESQAPGIHAAVHAIVAGALKALTG